MLFTHTFRVFTVHVFATFVQCACLHCITPYCFANTNFLQVSWRTGRKLHGHYTPLSKPCFLPCVLQVPGVSLTLVVHPATSGFHLGQAGSCGGYYCSSVICTLSGQLRPDQGQHLVHLLRCHSKICMMALAVQSELSNEVIKIPLLSPLLVDGVNPKHMPSSTPSLQSP